MLQLDFLGLNIYRHSSAYVWSDRVACTIHADAVPGPPAALREDKEKYIEDREHCQGSITEIEREITDFLSFTDLSIMGIPSLVTGPIPSYCRRPNCAILRGRSLSVSGSLIYSCLTL